MGVRLSDLPASVQAKLRAEGKVTMRRGKYGAEPVIDEETGRRVASKRELKLLRRLRMEADPLGYVVALQPRFVIEGGTYTADAMLINLGDQFVRDRVAVYDAKGHDTPASRKSRKQVRERYGITVFVE